MSNVKEHATEIYAKHLHLAATNGRLFRKTVMDELIEKHNCSTASAATHYNNCKKAGPVVAGLGRAPVPKTARKMPKGTVIEPEVDDNDCFTVLEILKQGTVKTVGRTHSFEGLGLARIKFNELVVRSPGEHWIIIQGLGPNHGDNFKLDTGEKIIVEYMPQTNEA